MDGLKNVTEQLEAKACHMNGLNPLKNVAEVNEAMGSLRNVASKAFDSG